MLDDRVAVVPEQRVATEFAPKHARERWPEERASVDLTAPGPRPTAYGDVDPGTWSRPLFTARCRARISKDDAVGIYHGRCQLPRGHEESHGFQDGFIVVLWHVATDVR